MDIVERLREVPVNTTHWVKCHDAADEIERLRIDLEVAEDRKTNAQLFQNDMLKEIERLREALQHILTHCKSDAPPNAQALILFANNALGGE